MNTEDKQAWCLAAEIEERRFVEERLPELGLTGEINPAKKFDKYAHDMFVNGWPADLKSQKTPLFKARELFGLDPQYVVSFNENDGKRYSDNYPNIMVFFDVDWQETTRFIGGRLYEVEPFRATYAALLDSVWRAIESDGLQKHDYLNRVDDVLGNAKSSWIFDVRRLHRLVEL